MINKCDDALFFILLMPQIFADERRFDLRSSAKICG